MKNEAFSLNIFDDMQPKDLLKYFEHGDRVKISRLEGIQCAPTYVYMILHGDFIPQGNKAIIFANKVVEATRRYLKEKYENKQRNDPQGLFTLYTTSINTDADKPFVEAFELLKLCKNTQLNEIIANHYVVQSKNKNK